MSDSVETPLPASSSPQSQLDRDRLAGELPPVQPPSAGLIVQLFVVPGLIVLVIVGVWALFGKLAAGEQDWQKLVSELKSDNEHRRWRAAYGLAQLLQTDRQAAELASNPTIAQALSELLSDELEKRSDDEKVLNNQMFLSRAVGYSDVHSVTFPVLTAAMDSSRDRELRKSAIASVALTAGRAGERGLPLRTPEMVETLIDTSLDSDPLMRQMSVYALALFPTQKGEERLREMLEDLDYSTRVNASIGLARQQSTAGFEILEEVLQTSAKNLGEDFEGIDPEDLEASRFQDFQLLKNSLKALYDLQGKLTESQKQSLLTLLKPIADGYRAPAMRIDATKLMKALEGK